MTGITNWDKSYYKVVKVIYYKENGSILIANGVGIIEWASFIAKWDNYYRKGKYIFVTL